MPWDKRLPYETDIHVPFIVRGPGIQPRTISNFPISAVDIAPTILDLANLTIPNYMDGVSFKKHLFKVDDFVEKVILIEYTGEGNAKTVSSYCPQVQDSNVAVSVTLKILNDYLQIFCFIFEGMHFRELV